MDSPLGGVFLRLREDNSVALVPISGTTNHATGATTVTDGAYILIDPDGADSRNILTDGVAELDAPTLGSLGTQLYDYTGGFLFTYPDNSGSIPAAAGLVVGGIITQPQDMPLTGGGVIYGGDAIASYETGLQAVTLENGVSVVTVDFGAGLVDVTMDQFSALDTDTEVPVAAPLINGMSVTGMQISGSEFSGGTLVTTLDGVPVAVTGPGANDSAAGAFFGYSDVRSGPAEVGGMVLSEDATSAVLGAFVAK